MLSKNELRYTLALQRVPNLGDASAKKLITKIGSAEGVFKERKSNLLKIDGIGANKIRDLDLQLRLEEADEELQFIYQNKVKYSFFKDVDYPDRLKQCIDGPILYFYSGNIDIKHKKVISIVGTRQITPSGKEFCRTLIEQLSPLNPVIVSGYAYGADITAHIAAMQNGLQTIACLAHGLNQIYPRAHKKYMNEVNDNGGFITDFWSSDNFDRTNFLRRNRIIAGLSEATVVIESAEKGGSLVTADIANSYDREVFAVPGKPEDTLSVGCNALIKRQQAHLLTSAADLIYMLGWELEAKNSPSKQTKLFVSLTMEEQKIADYLTKRGREQLDIIALECKLPLHKTASLLLQMELKGLVRPLLGKYFQII